MSIEEIISKKENGDILTHNEIKYIIDILTNDTISDNKLKLVLNDMSEDEVINMTDILLSNNKINLGSNESVITGKYSFGYIDDKTSLVLASILAACDIKFIGFSDETLNKAKEDVGKEFESVGSIIINKSSFLDKKIKLEDFPLPVIAANAMSQVLSLCINNIVFDIKFGKQSLIKNEEDATLLANLLIKIGKKYNCKVICFIINGDIILGNAFGYNLKIKEVAKILEDPSSSDIIKLSIELASHLISSVKSMPLVDAFNLALAKLKNGSAYEKMKEIVNIDELKLSDHIFSIKSNKTGFIKYIDILKIQDLVDKIDGNNPSDDTVGIVLSKNIGDYVMENEELAKVYLNKIDLPISEVLDCFEITDMVGNLTQLVSKIME